MGRHACRVGGTRPKALKTFISDFGDAPHAFCGACVFFNNVKWLGGSPAIFFENARIIDPLNDETRGTLRIVGKRIDGINNAPQRDDIRFDLDGALVLPGLLNAHDHLELNNFPRLKGRERYSNAREWAMELNARLDTEPEIVTARAVPLADRLLIGGLKNLLAGVTTVAHHNPFHAPLRKNYPVRVVAQYGWSHSIYLSPDFAQAYKRTPHDAPYMIHLAEGTDEDAKGELTQLDEAGALHDNTVLIHGVGLTEMQRAHAIAKHTALVWCPSSNFFLLGATASVTEFSYAHLLAIGSDSRLTGERDLLDELRAARETKQISGDALLRAVTCDAANILRVNDAGRIAQGTRADLMILPKSYASAAAAMGVVKRAELRAVFVQGQFRVGDSDFASFAPKAARVVVDEHEKLLDAALAKRLSANSIQEKGVSL